MNLLLKNLRSIVEHCPASANKYRVIAVSNLALFFAVFTPSSHLHAQSMKVTAIHRQSNFGFSDQGSSKSTVLFNLVQLNQLDTADRFLLRWLRSSQEDTRDRLALATEYQSLRLSSYIKSLDVSRRSYDEVRSEIENKLKDYAASLRSELFNSDSQSPYDEEAHLFFEFASQKSFLDLARQYVATSLVSTRDEALRSSAQRSIFDSIDALETLNKSAEDRIAKLATLQSENSRQALSNELYRLINEVHLLKVDLLAMQLEFVRLADEAEKVAAANNLRNEIDLITSKISADSAYSPRLNLLRAKSMAALGDYEKAIVLLDEDLLRIANEQMLLDNRRTAAEILLAAKSPISTDRARAILMEMLLNVETIPASIVLSAFEYNALRATNDSTRFRTDLELSVSSGEQVAQSMTQDLSLADVLQQKEAIGKQFGAYWRLRAEAILLGISNSMASATSGDPSLPIDLMLAAVKQDLLANRFREAITKLSNIEEQYTQQNNPSAAFATSQRRNALFYQLLRKEEERAVTENTRRARLEIARKFRESAEKYAPLQEVDPEFVRSIQIAQAALSSDAQLNKTVVSFIEDTAIHHANHFPTMKSVSQSFEAVEFLLATLGNYERISDLYRSWQSTAASKQADQQLIEYASNRQASYLAFHYLTTELPIAFDDLLTTSEASNRDRAELKKVISSAYWSDRIALDPTGETKADDGQTTPWIIQLYSDRQRLLDAASRGSHNDQQDIRQIESPEVFIAELIKLNLRSEVLLSLSSRTDTTLLEMVENQLGRFDILREQHGKLSSLHKSASFYLVRNRAIASVIRSGGTADLTEYRQYVAERQSFENMIWYARLLTKQGVEGQKSASNLLTRLTGKEPIGSLNWYRGKADLLYIKSLTKNKQDALSDLEYLMTIAPNTSEVWKREIISKIAP